MEREFAVYLPVRMLTGGFLAIVMAPVLVAAPYVLPQLAYGGGWSTTLYLSNTGTQSAGVTLDFYGNEGVALQALTLVGVTLSSWSTTLPSGGAITLDFPNAGDLKQGWIALELPSGVSGYAVFRQTVAGRADQEAVVPLGPAGAASASFPFDNRSMVTAIAVVNPTASAVVVNVAARNAGGQALGNTLVPLGPRSKTALALSDLPGLAAAGGVQGTVDFVTAAPGAVSVLGLRFRGAAFTSIPAYHGPVSTTSATAAIPAPVLQASPTSSTTADLNWTTTTRLHTTPPSVPVVRFAGLPADLPRDPPADPIGCSVSPACSAPEAHRVDIRGHCKSTF